MPERIYAHSRVKVAVLAADRLHIFLYRGCDKFSRHKLLKRNDPHTAYAFICQLLPVFSLITNLFILVTLICHVKKWL